METFDSQNFKQRDAASYDLVIEQFDHFTTAFSGSLAEHLISLAGINLTDNVLDVGTGTGVVALQVAQLRDFKGKVTGIDLSKEMLAKATNKAKQYELNEKLIFQEMDAEKLTFDNRHFDITVSLFALLHFSNPLKALQEIYRVTRPGGHLVLAFGSGIPLYSLLGWRKFPARIPDFLMKFLGKYLIAPQFLDSLLEQNVPRSSQPEESEVATHHHSNRPQIVIDLVKKAGFKVIKTDWFGQQNIIESPKEFWEIQRTFSSIARKRLLESSPMVVESLYQKFIEQCREFQSKGGKLVYPTGAFYIVAQRN